MMLLLLLVLLLFLSDDAARTEERGEMSDVARLGQFAGATRWNSELRARLDWGSMSIRRKFKRGEPLQLRKSRCAFRCACVEQQQRRFTRLNHTESPQHA
jgi:hypothetical protein